MTGATGKTPIFLFAGFLGAGKTTLLSTMLKSGAMRDSLFIVNEIGMDGVDQDLLRQGQTNEPVLLPDGCLCCQMKKDLGYTLRDMRARAERGEIPAFDRVIVETTGLADPGPILQQCQTDPVLARFFEVAGVNVVIDAQNFDASRSAHDEVLLQLVHADTLVISKADLVEDGAAALIAELRLLAPQAEIVTTQDEGLDKTLLAIRSRMFVRPPRPGPTYPFATKDAGRHGIAVTTIDVDDSLTWSQFATCMDNLLAQFGHLIPRTKGFVKVSDLPQPICVHAVRNTFYPPTMIAPDTRIDHPGRLVLIHLSNLRMNVAAGFEAQLSPARRRADVQAPDRPEPVASRLN